MDHSNQPVSLPLLRTSPLASHHNTNSLRPYSFNATSIPNTDLHLDFRYSAPTRPISQWGAHNTIALAISAAREHGHDERVPRAGFRVKTDDVWLHTYPLFIGFTWGLLDFTVRQVEAELETTGYFACTWELSRTEDGLSGRIYARGDMWPNVVPQSKQM